MAARKGPFPRKNGVAWVPKTRVDPMRLERYREAWRANQLSTRRGDDLGWLDWIREALDNQADDDLEPAE